MEGMTLIVKTIARLLAPLMLLVGLYIVVHGHLTPGGGFQGGVMLASTLVLLLLAFGLNFIESKLGFKQTEMLKGFSTGMIVVVALVGLIFGTWLFKNVGVYWYGVPGEVFSAGSLILYNIWEGTHVAVAFLIVFYCLTKRGDEK